MSKADDALYALETALDMGNHITLSHADADTIRAALEENDRLRAAITETLRLTEHDWGRKWTGYVVACGHANITLRAAIQDTDDTTA